MRPTAPSARAALGLATLSTLARSLAEDSQRLAAAAPFADDRAASSIILAVHRVAEARRLVLGGPETPIIPERNDT